MRRESIDAFIFPSTDPHNGEYVPEHWEGRKWITGFNGSAGTAVVTADDAALWTDSRYFIAAGQQLEGTGIKLMKERVEGTPTITKWLGMKLATASSPTVGVDGTVNSAAAVTKAAGSPDAATMAAYRLTTGSCRMPRTITSPRRRRSICSSFIFITSP